MRKNDLIKMLQDLPGNPEVVFWNGFVNDYHHIDRNVETVTLVKETREFVRHCLTLASGGVPPTEQTLDAAMKRREWERPNEFVDPNEHQQWYGTKKKKLYVLQGLPRGKTMWDRMGDMEY